MGHSHIRCNISIVLFFVLCYITTTPTFCLCSQVSNFSCIEIERHALLNFKNSLIDPSNRLSSWTGQDCCKWSGVQCNNQSWHVIKLDLRNPHPFNETNYVENKGWDPQYAKSCLIGREVSHSLLDLNHLQHLDLSWNNFSGIPIPNFLGSFPELTYLNLSSCCFSGVVPHHIGNLSTLQSLDISSSFDLESNYGLPQLSAHNLDWVSSLSHLQCLDMSHVHLSQASNPIQAIDFLPHLLELRLAGCDLAPSVLSISYINLTSLVVFDLSSNYFSGGPLPNFLENMTSLEHLVLSNNYFNGTIQVDLSRLCNLKVLDFSYGELHGGIFKLFENTSSQCFEGNKLESLDLSSNKLRGYLPNWLGQLKNLKYLFLDYNSLTGPIARENLLELSQLETLSLRMNKFNGSLPNSFGRLENLKELNLQYNGFQGPIPRSLGELSSLRNLDLSLNQLNGTIPDSFGQLSKLETLNLGQNSLEGVMTEVHFSKLSNLKLLDLASNSLSLKVRSNWVPPFQLEEINLNSCKVKQKFPMWFKTQKKLKNVGMSNAIIMDSMPEWFFNFSHHLSPFIDLDFSSNQIYGEVPNIFSSRDVRWMNFDLGENKFEGTLPNIPRNLHSLDLSQNKISGFIPENIGVMGFQLQNLVLSNNSINGSIPRSFCKLKALEFLDLSMNNLEGTLPKCLGNLQNLSVLDLSSNNLWGTILNVAGNMELAMLDLSSNHLSGIIPTSIGKLVLLEWLHLNDNKLEDQIPLSLENCSSLVMLDLGENKLSGYIPTFKSMSKLRFLSLRSNRLSGTIPVPLCQLVNLQVVDLSQNNILGTIPHCFRSFTHMKVTGDTSWYDTSKNNGQITLYVKGREFEYTKTLPFLTSLDLSSNELAGSIPEELTILTALTVLNLSRNHLGGSIPENIGKMVSLESLDLSGNHISGEIPESISALDFLQKINLSHNNFSGKIPSGKHLETLGDPSDIYGDNPQLCGVLLENKCRSNELSLPPPSVDGMPKNKSQKSEMNGFYIGMAAGHVVGFWGVCGVLFFNKTWRIAFFRTLSNFTNFFLVAVAVNVARLKRKLEKNQV